MKSNLVSKTESHQIIREISEQWRMDLPRTRNLKIHDITDDAQLVTGQGFRALRLQGAYVPFLTETDILGRFPSVVVDMGAVRFMCNGANVMIPGITECTEFGRGELVCIVEESQRKFLAVGRSVMSSSEIGESDRGEAVENMHYISDRFWQAGKDIS